MTTEQEIGQTVSDLDLEHLTEFREWLTASDAGT